MDFRHLCLYTIADIIAIRHTDRECYQEGDAIKTIIYIKKTLDVELHSHGIVPIFK